MRFTIVICVVVLSVIWGIPMASKYTEVAAEGSTSSRGESASVDPVRVYAPGLVEGSCREISLSFEVLGRLKAILVKEGGSVQEGEALARLNSETWEHELARAEASLRLAQAERTRMVNGVSQESLNVLRAEVTISDVHFRHAQNNLKRAINLAQVRSIADQAIDDRTAEFEEAQAKKESASAKVTEIAAEARLDDLQIADAKVALAEAQVRHAQESLAKCTLVAPRAGTIARIQAEPGELVGPESAQPIVTIVSTEQLHVRAYVDELDAVRVELGMRAYVTVDGMPHSRFYGQVVACSPVMVTKENITDKPGERRDAKVREALIVLDQQDDVARLVIGLPVDVSFERNRS